MAQTVPEPRHRRAAIRQKRLRPQDGPDKLGRWSRPGGHGCALA
jgi:hypothetical protein